MAALSSARLKKRWWCRRRQDPPFGDEHGGFRLGLIPRAAGPGGHDRGAVVTGELQVGPVDHRLVAGSLRDAAAQVVGHDHRRGAPEELEHAHVGPDPVRELLRGTGLGVGVAGGAQDADEELDQHRRPSRGVPEHGPLAREVHEGLLPGAVDLTHGRGQGPYPAVVVGAELAVAMALGMGLDELQPQALQRHAWALEFLVDPDHVRQGAWNPHQVTDPSEQPGLELAVVQLLGQGPPQACLGGPPTVFRDRAHADATGPGDGPVGQAGPELQPQNLPHLPHPYPLRWHVGPSFLEVPYRRRRAPEERSRWPESVIRMDRNERSGSVGISDQDGPEYATRLPLSVCRSCARARRGW
jgi:hypothetical protein